MEQPEVKTKIILELSRFSITNGHNVVPKCLVNDTLNKKNFAF